MEEEKKKSKKKEIERLLEELEKEKEKSLRVQAELINYKRRKDEEVASFYKYEGEKLILELLPLVDNFERAIQLDDHDLSDEVSKFLTGFKMMYTSLVGILKSAGVEEIEAKGVEFNPNIHQAVLTEKDETKPSGVVLEVLQKGYMYKDKVIRPAMVKVND